jgi:membrane protein DedA with SNARE-associated domain/membrane-associated phospholipid phosphatase
MQNGWLDHIVAWIAANPIAAGGVIFLIAFCDSVIVLGIVVPALPLLFAVGALIGLGHIDGPYALLCAAAGAFVGDGLSYWIGHRWGPALRQRWPFSRYPQLIDRGERLFRRHGTKGIVIARYVGAVRPFVPAVAGMLHMPLKRYIPASTIAALSWAGIFLAPGWMFGASYDAVAAVADRLALVLLALVAVLALVWASVLYTYRWFAGHADRLLARALKWTRAHPRLGHYFDSLIQPHRPESASLAMLAVCLIGIGWASFGLLAAVLARGGPLAMDYQAQATMAALRNPLADRMMAALASLGDPLVLLPPLVLTTAWLLWRRCYTAAWHWIAAVGFGVVFTTIMGVLVDMPKPPAAPSGFGFPSIPITLLTIVFGFFAVLIARELPGKQRVWPYLVAGAAVALLGFARLYFGAHWLSDIIGGMLFGIVWLLILGIAYRRHIKRSFWMAPLAAIFYISFAVAALWYAPRTIDGVLARFVTHVERERMKRDAWWDDDWALLPAQRDEHAQNRRWPLDIQIAGPLDAVRIKLQSQGWQLQPQANWIGILGLLDPKRSLSRQPVLPATLDTETEVLLMRRPGRNAESLHVLRLWRAPVVLENGEPLWIGTAQSLRFNRPIRGFGLWLPESDHSAAHAQVRQDLAGLRLAESARPGNDILVLRVRSQEVERR